MEAKSFKQLTISVEKLPASMARQAEINSYAAERARLLLGCYRTGEANDPETYVAAITAVLSRYPEQVITSVTHPVSGLPSSIKWLPSVTEVREECERAVLPIASNLARQKRIAEQMALRRQEDEERAEPRPSYAELKAKHGETWGIGADQSAPMDPAIAERAERRKQRAMLDEYAALGIAPQYTSMGDLISPSLAKQIAGTRELADHIDNGFSPGTAA